MNTLPELPLAHSIQDVLNNLDTILKWSCTQPSRIGYFASLYKQITFAIRAAINTPGEFQHPELMATLDHAFANRYFNALNAFFYPNSNYPMLSKSWQVSLDGASESKPIIAQQLLTAVNAHIELDLGIATQQAVPVDQLADFHSDFLKINKILEQKVLKTISEMDDLSPVMKDIYGVLGKYEKDIVDDGLVFTRKSAWDFANSLAESSSEHRSVIEATRDSEIAIIGKYILNPTLLTWIVDLIASREVRDVSAIVNELSGGSCN